MRVLLFIALLSVESFTRADDDPAIMQIVDTMTRSFDVNDNGYLDLDEIDEAFDVMDSDGDRKVSEDEFHRSLLERADPSIASSTVYFAAMLTFRNIDHDLNEFVTRDEILPNIELIDVDDDERISMEDFRRYLILLVRGAVPSGAGEGQGNIRSQWLEEFLHQRAEHRRI